MQTHSVLTITTTRQVDITARAAAALEEIVAEEGSSQRCSELSEIGGWGGERDQVMTQPGTISDQPVFICLLYLGVTF